MTVGVSVDVSVDVGRAVLGATGVKSLFVGWYSLPSPQDCQVNVLYWLPEMVNPNEQRNPFYLSFTPPSLRAKNTIHTEKRLFHPRRPRPLSHQRILWTEIPEADSARTSLRFHVHRRNFDERQCANLHLGGRLGMTNTTRVLKQRREALRKIEERICPHDRDRWTAQLSSGQTQCRRSRNFGQVHLGQVLSDRVSENIKPRQAVSCKNNHRVQLKK